MTVYELVKAPYAKRADGNGKKYGVENREEECEYFQ